VIASFWLGQGPLRAEREEAREGLNGSRGQHPLGSSLDKMEGAEHLAELEVSLAAVSAFWNGVQKVVMGALHPACLLIRLAYLGAHLIMLLGELCNF